MENGKQNENCDPVSHTGDCSCHRPRGRFERCYSALRNWLKSDVRSTFSLKIDFESSLALLLLYTAVGIVAGQAIVEGVK